MNTPLNKFDDALAEFLNLNIYFNESNIQYRFQGIWISSNFEMEITQKLYNLENLLFLQLKSGLNNKSLLLEIQAKARETSNILYDVYFDEYNDLSKSNLRVVKTSVFYEKENEDIFTYEHFRRYLTEDTESFSLEHDSYFESAPFRFLHDLFQDFQNSNKEIPKKLQFENARLLSCLFCFSELIYVFLSRIDYYLLRYDYIDFSNIGIEEEKTVTLSHEKCKTNLSKIEIARFVSFLLCDKIIYFDPSNDKNNKIKVQKFIEDNFTYKSSDGKQVELRTLTRELAEIKMHNSKIDYNKVIDEFMLILTAKRKT